MHATYDIVTTCSILTHQGCDSSHQYFVQRAGTSSGIDGPQVTIAILCCTHLMLPSLLSMGGAIALRSANQIPSLVAVAVIDVVEGRYYLE